MIAYFTDIPSVCQGLYDFFIDIFQPAAQEIAHETDDLVIVTIGIAWLNRIGQWPMVACGPNGLYRYLIVFHKYTCTALSVELLDNVRKSTLYSQFFL